MASKPWVIIAVLIIIILAAVIESWLRKKYPSKKKEKYPEGHFYEKGLATFIAIGVVMGVVLGSLSIGIGAGIILGLIIGGIWEQRAKKEKKIRPLTKKEMLKKQTVLVWVIAILGILFLLLGLLFYLAA